MTVTSPLAVSNVAGAADEAGASLTKAYQRKLRDTAEACRQEGLVFLPFAMETQGGLWCRDAGEATSCSFGKVQGLQ